MVSLFVRAHWTDVPVGGVQQQPAPAWLLSYPGNVPQQDLGAKWPASPPGPRDAYAVWVPLVRGSDLAGAGWATGPSWAGSPPQPWPALSGAPPGTADEGYGSATPGFRVNRLRLFQDMAPGTDFEFTVFAPDGTNVGTVPSAIG